MAQTEHEIVVANEAFLIGVLQAVSGGSLIAGISQVDAMVRLAGKVSLLLFLTLLTASLLTAVLAAYWRHEYKKWNLKSGVSKARGEDEEARTRRAKAASDLDQMRTSFLISLGGIIGAYAVLIMSMWFHGP